MKEMKKYCLKDYKELLEKEGLVAEADLKENGENQVDILTFNSKEAAPGTLFICKGKTFKEDYLKEALEAGALCYVSAEKYSEDVPYIIVNDIRKAMSALADKFFCRPYEDLKIVGLTGTKGKTTSTFFIKSIIDDYMAATGGRESAYLSTMTQYDGVISGPVYITTPEAVELMGHYRNAVDSGIEYFTMEVSSQGLKYDRVDNVTFEVAIFTNISEDHISPKEHPDFEDYFTSKLKIFNQCETACVNLNTDQLPRVMEAAKNAKRLITYGTTEDADIYTYNIRKENGNITFDVKCDRFTQTFQLSIMGMFNVENALTAISAAYALDIPVEYIYSGLKKCQPPCHMELHPSKDNKVIIIVDFAHNKLSYTKLLEAVKEEFPGYRICAVFGCAGGKVYNRRRDVGTLTGKHCNKVYITAEHPGPEKFEDISEEIAGYVRAQGGVYDIIEDRGEALQKAVDEATEPTVILITGCGEMKYQRYNGITLSRPSDVEYANECIAKYNETH